MVYGFSGLQRERIARGKRSSLSIVVGIATLTAGSLFDVGSASGFPSYGTYCANCHSDGRCSVDASCDDGDPCTQDSCSSGKCQYTAMTGCCASAADCGSAPACTQATCQNNTCVFEPVADCCVDDADCAAGPACTQTSCVNSACVTAQVAGCCTADSQCDDGDLCTSDACVASSCQFDPIAGCGDPLPPPTTEPDAGIQPPSSPDAGTEPPPAPADASVDPPSSADAGVPSGDDDDDRDDGDRDDGDRDDGDRDDGDRDEGACSPGDMGSWLSEIDLETVLADLGSRRDQRKCRRVYDSCERIRQRCVGRLAGCQRRDDVIACDHEVRCTCDRSLGACQASLSKVCGTNYSADYGTGQEAQLSGGCQATSASPVGFGRVVGLALLLVGLGLVVWRRRRCRSR